MIVIKLKPIANFKRIMIPHQSMRYIVESYRCVSCRKTGLIKHESDKSLSEIECPSCRRTDLYFNLNQFVIFPSN